MLPARLPFRVPNLERALERLVGQVPVGRVTTYGALARALGHVVAARWVAKHLGESDALPGHRVVLKSGALGKAAGLTREAQRQRLIEEGVPVPQDRVDLERYGFDAFHGPQPLASLREVQEAQMQALDLRPPNEIPRYVGGVDVSYAPGDEAVAAYVLCDTHSAEVVWSVIHRQPARFPYIPSYLSFRELPVLLGLLKRAERAGKLPDVVFVDGAGILHHRHAGIATHLGLVTGLSTIGITKKRLCGRVDATTLLVGEAAPVIYREATIAMALRTLAGRPEIYVSPGQRVDMPFALDLTNRLLRGHFLPEPTHWAHTLSRAAAKQA